MNPEELIRFIAVAIVDFPAKVKVNAVEGIQRTVIEFEVAKQDTGQIIGKKGRTAEALRPFLHSIASKTNGIFLT